jgi:hypothetical protein
VYHLAATERALEMMVDAERKMLKKKKCRTTTTMTMTEEKKN